MRIIDVSNVNGPVNWESAAAAGVTHVYLKATEGATFNDPDYIRNRNGARAHGIKVGSYHYARPDHNPATAEALHFLRTSIATQDDLLPALDLEQKAQLAPPGLVAWAEAWLGIVEARVGHPILLYTYPDYWRSACGDSGACSDRPLWLADYGPNDGKRHPAEPVGAWKRIALHQFTSSAYVAGIDGDVDESWTDDIVSLLRPVAHRPWPVPLPVWWWGWNRWRLGGRRGARPRNAPRLIPGWAWRRAEAFDKAREK